MDVESSEVLEGGRGFRVGIAIYPMAPFVPYTAVFEQLRKKRFKHMYNLYRGEQPTAKQYKLAVPKEAREMARKEISELKKARFEQVNPRLPF